MSPKTAVLIALAALIFAICVGLGSYAFLDDPDPDAAQERIPIVFFAWGPPEHLSPHPG